MTYLVFERKFKELDIFRHIGKNSKFANTKKSSEIEADRHPSNTQHLQFYYFRNTFCPHSAHAEMNIFVPQSR